MTATRTEAPDGTVTIDDGRVREVYNPLAMLSRGLKDDIEKHVAEIMNRAMATCDRHGGRVPYHDLVRLANDGLTNYIWVCRACHEELEATTKPAADKLVAEVDKDKETRAEWEGLRQRGHGLLGLVESPYDAAAGIDKFFLENIHFPVLAIDPAMGPDEATRAEWEGWRAVGRDLLVFDDPQNETPYDAEAAQKWFREQVTAVMAYSAIECTALSWSGKPGDVCVKCGRAPKDHAIIHIQSRTHHDDISGTIMDFTDYPILSIDSALGPDETAVAIVDKDGWTTGQRHMFTARIPVDDGFTMYGTACAEPDPPTLGISFLLKPPETEEQRNERIWQAVKEIAGGM